MNASAVKRVQLFYITKLSKLIKSYKQSSYVERSCMKGWSVAFCTFLPQCIFVFKKMLFMKYIADEGNSYN